MELFRITSFRARVLCYSTEDPAKVRKALRNVIGEDIQILSRKVEGYYKDSIHILECRSNDERVVRRVFNKILGALGYNAERFIKEGIEMTSKEHGKIHIRLDKQEAYRGKIIPSDQDSIKIEFSFIGEPDELLNIIGEPL